RGRRCCPVFLSYRIIVIRPVPPARRAPESPRSPPLEEVPGQPGRPSPAFHRAGGSSSLGCARQSNLEGYSDLSSRLLAHGARLNGPHRRNLAHFVSHLGFLPEPIFAFLAIAWW